MAKAPKAGMVKTRLAAGLPPAEIIGLYRCLLEDTLALAQSLEGVETAIMSPASDVEELSRIAGGEVSVVGQTGEGLGAALTSVFAHFAAAGQRRIVAFNSDSPHLPATALLMAFHALRSCDLAVGPTQDGGYYLVGATASHPGLFAGSPLGTTNALEALLARARSLALSVRLTDPFYDVDVPADLSRLAEELRLTPERAPRTARWLTEWARTAPRKQASATDL
jgi:rSAM/selenodomain-associated transferase 1